MNLEIKQLEGIDGFIDLRPLEGTSKWYWCSSSTDIYEAEEALENGIELEGSELFLIHYPDGKVYCPLSKKEKVYIGTPVWDNGRIGILTVDFNLKIIKIYYFISESVETNLIATIPLSEVLDCYNLLLHTDPLMLTRQENDNKFEIVWPEKIIFDIGDTESFICRDGEKLYFSAWYENNDYHEEIIVRDYRTGKVLEKSPGILYHMPDGSWWKIPGTQKENE